MVFGKELLMKLEMKIARKNNDVQVMNIMDILEIVIVGNVQKKILDFNPLTPISSMKKEIKAKIKWGKTPAEQLYKAVVRYIEANGGTAVVIGSIALVQETPLKFNYGVMVRVTGKKPIFKVKETLTPNISR